MTELFQKQIRKLEQRLQAQCTLVEETLQKAVKAFEERDEKLAQEVIDGDDVIDKEEIDIEEQCLQIMALYQPVAQDLRFLVAALKINNDLERAGDLTKNIAKRVYTLTAHPEISVPFDFHTMAGDAVKILKESLHAFNEFDVEEAKEVLEMDNRIDDENREAADRIALAVSENKQAENYVLFQFFAVARMLERLGDLATNIAEDIIYILEGVIIRHGHDQP